MEVLRWKLLFCLIAVFLTPLRTEGSKKVSVDLYYETLCPYCSSFIVNYLQKFFSNGLINVVDLHLVPYGNARILPNGTIECQMYKARIKHGPYECFLNAVEACAIDIWPDVHDHFRYIYCVESLVVKHEYTEWETCFTKTSTDIQRLAECYNTGHWKKLELQYEAETSALQPPHKYVPWVVVNGHPLYEDYEDVEKYICKSYQGATPEACKSIDVESLIDNRDHYGHVTYVDEVRTATTA